jgi:hypothetical protein
LSDSPERPVLEIRDPEIDAGAVLQHVAEGVARRRASGAYGPDPLSLGPVALRSGTPPQDEPIDAFLDFQARHEALAEMGARAHLQDLRFRSDLPLLGPVLAAVRSAWAWMAARWIGQHLGQQQSAFNAANVRLGQELTRRQDADLWRLRQLETRLHELEARLARLESPDPAGEEADR